MASRFCAYCGIAVRWPTAANGRLVTKQSCSGCGRDLYRNPDVYVLCLAHRAESVGLASGTLADHETIQEASKRLAARYRLAPGPAIDPRLFAVVNDLDTDRVYIVFSVEADEPVTDHADESAGRWVAHLKARLCRELSLGRRQVHSVIVRAGKLRFRPQIAR